LPSVTRRCRRWRTTIVRQLLDSRILKIASDERPQLVQFFLLALRVRTLPSVCSFFQLIGGLHDRDQIAFENGIEKVIPAVPEKES